MSVAPPRRGRWLLREPAPDAAARLFCLPYSGCGASMYRMWPRTAGDVEICPVQLPGRENRMREPPFASYEETAAAVAEAIAPYLDRPFGLFGHCGSALPAYQTAVVLERAGGPAPACLFVSSQVAPQDGPHGRFLEMTDEALMEEMKNLVRALGKEPDPDLISLSLGVLRADVEANKKYFLPEPPRVSCPIAVIGWDQDVEVDPGLIGGWAACGTVEFHLLCGEHYRFLAAPGELMELFAGLGASAPTPAPATGVEG